MSVLERRIRARRGDVLVLTVPTRLSQAQHAQMRKFARELHERTGVVALVVDAGIEAQVARPSRSLSPLQLLGLAFIVGLIVRRRGA